MKYSTKRVQAFLYQALLTYLVLLNPATAGLTSEWDSQDFGRVRLISGVSGLGNGTGIELGLEFQLQPEWKIYWRSPGDAGSPPILETSESTNLRAIEMKWPWPLRFDEGENLTTVGYLNHTIFPITAYAQNEHKPLALRAHIEYQACKTICIPVSAYTELIVPSGKKDPTQYALLIENFKNKVPVPVKPPASTISSVYSPTTHDEGVLTIRIHSEKPFHNPSIFLEGDNDYGFGRETISFSNSSQTATFVIPVVNVGGKNLENYELRVTLVDQSRAIEFLHRVEKVGKKNSRSNSKSFILILVTAVLGGLILNLMPCVLPVLSIKILSVLQNIGGNSWKVRMSFLASAAGIIASYLLLALGTIILQTAGKTIGWGMQFQEPIFLIFLVIVLTLFSCNLLGFLEVRSLSVGNTAVAPPKAGRKRNGISESFFTGAFATLLATPCSAPFVGTSISFALSRGKLEVLLIFLMLGLGMAAPYLLFAIKPNLVSRLPKPGKWMIHLRTVLGFGLVATALWLLAVLSDQTSVMFAWAIGTAMVACGLLLNISSRMIHKHKNLLLGFVIILAGCSLAVPFFSDFLQPTTGPKMTSNSEGTGWIDFNENRLESLVRSGNTVFVDITADWCLTCKINERLVLGRSQIRNRLRSSEIVWMRGDWTRKNSQIQEYLISFNRFGIPFNAVYGNNAPNGILLPELLTKKDVLSALEIASREQEPN